MQSKKNRASRRARQRSMFVVATAGAILAAASVQASPPGANPEWQADVYYAVGSVVQYSGHRYSALISQIDFQGTGWSPAVATLWRDLGADPGERKANFLKTLLTPSGDSSSCAPEWNANNVYTSGGVASLDGVNYKANWWTQGESPATHSAGRSGQPWSIAGTCTRPSRTVDGVSGAQHPNEPPVNEPPVSEPPSERAAKATREDHKG